ncbi:hypothetical protein SUDANB150_00049 [Streptomyces sp. enrichment culture]
MIALTSLPMLDGLGTPATFWLFTGICVLFVVFCLRVPETKGRTLEELEARFRVTAGKRGRLAGA